jgi:hypothetical protein
MFANKTILALGHSEENGLIIPARILEGTQAYEAYHLHKYFAELISSKNYLKHIASGSRPFSWKDVPRPDRAFSLMHDIFLSDMLNMPISKTELGGSLLEIIYGYDICIKALENERNQKNQHLPATLGINKWNSIEVSKLFRDICDLIHPTRCISTFESVHNYYSNSSLDAPFTIKSLYDRAVSSYAFTDTISYAEFLLMFDIGFVQILGFLENEAIINDPIGTKLLYFNLSELQDNLVKGGAELSYYYGHRRPTRPAILDENEDCIEAFFLYSKNSFPKELASEAASLSPLCNKFYSSVESHHSAVSNLQSIGISTIKSCI